MKQLIREVDADICEKDYLEKINKIKVYVNESLKELYDNDKHLIDNRTIFSKEKDGNHYVGERAIVFRFAHYLLMKINADKEFENYDLDCEYNRNGVKCKNLPSFPNVTFPDVIIHKRGSNEYNLLIMEFKTYWNKNTDSDIKKIKEFTDSRYQYKYLLGASVIINKSYKDVCIKYFVDGKQEL